MAVGTTAFPTSLDTIVELVEITNNASSTLSGNVLIGDTTIGVTDISEFPTTGYGTIADDLTTPTKVEIISWTGKSGSNLTGCTRGTQGTSAAAFSSGNYIEVRPTAGHHEALRGAVIAIEAKLGTGSTIAVNKLAALTASRLMVTDASGFASAASVTATEAGYLSGVTSAIQTQLGNKQGLDATLTALAAYNTNGIMAQTAADTFAGRTITGTSAKIDVSNGDGVSGNPTLTISATYAGQTSITTLGTVTTGTLSTGAVIGGVTMTLGSDADGDIYYRASGVLTRLAKGTSLQQLRMNVGATAPEWATITGGGGGDVVGPGSATDNAVVRFDSTTGKLVQDSVITIADTTGNMAGVGTLNGHTIPVGTDTFVLLTANQTLTTKTLTSPDINGGTADSLTSLSVRSTGAAFDLLFANTEVLTGNKTLTIKVNDTSRTVDLGGNLTLAAAFSTSGANALTLTTTGATNVTLPTTGTLVNSAVSSLSSLTTVGTITSGGLGTGAVIGGVTMTLGSDADGDIYYRSSNVLTRLAKGTALQQLRMNAGATAPEWATIAGGGGLTIGTTAITSGTAGRILYETSGNVVGETAGFAYQPAASPNLTITAQAASYVGLRINSAATPSVNIFETTVNGGADSGFIVTSTGAPHAPGNTTNTTNTLRYGSGSSVTAGATNSMAIGISTVVNNAGAGDTTLVGNGSSIGGFGSYHSTSLGYGNTANAYKSTLIGRVQRTGGSGNTNIAVGGNTNIEGPANIQIGWDGGITNTSATGNIFLGHSYSNSTAIVNTFIGGSGTYPINNVFFGKGDLHATPTAYAINGTGGSGSNIAGANINLAGGLGTGTGIPGTIGMQFARAGSTGSTLNTLSDEWRASYSTTDTVTLGANIKTSTTALTSAAAINALWTTATHASRTSAITLSTVDNAASLAERWRLSTNGAGTGVSTTTTGFFGSTNVTGMLSESITLSTSGTTTDSTIDLPANSIILSVTGRITTTITTATDWKLGDATISDRFSDANATLTSGTTTVGINQWKADRTTAGQGAFQQSTAKVRITTTGTPGAGVIRITIHYITLSAPTS